MIPHEKPLEHLDTLDGYRRYFMDVTFWEPYVHSVCARLGLASQPPVRAGLAGTYPTFIVADRWVIKFFGHLFEGEQSFAVEREMSVLLRPGKIPTPALIASGNTFEHLIAWPWPYLVYEFVPGISFGEVYERVAFSDRLALARDLGQFAQRLHALPITPSTVFRPDWGSYRTLLQKQRQACIAAHQAWQALPAHLMAQIDAFLLPVEDLVDWGRRPHLIHADITGDHILGQVRGARWATTAIIDWGDAMVGDLNYELSALHLDLFRGDKRLLAAFLDVYGLDAQSRTLLPKRALGVALLHRFNVLEGVFKRFPQAGEIPTLEQLAVALWDVQAPGLG
jgi:hypothetical protein